MKSAAAILTFNRLEALTVTLNGVLSHCPGRVAVFDDLSNKDGTAAFLRRSTAVIKDDYNYWAEVRKSTSFDAYLGLKNLGVAGNSNRALKWFMEETDADHLVLCNDDIEVGGNFAGAYARAHQDLNVGLFCFCDFTGQSYKWSEMKARGYTVKVLPRMTGIVMSVTRALVEKIGYFDTSFGPFGEEHCDYTNRARISGFMKIFDVDQSCLDVKLPAGMLKHQEVESSMTGMDRQRADAKAAAAMQRAVLTYPVRSQYRPFSLYTPDSVAGRDKVGIPFSNLSNPTVVYDWA